MSILLHTCCGPCLGGSIDILKESVENEKIDTFWYNPNIHPYIEYRSRMQSFIKLCTDLQLIIRSSDNSYGLEYFLNRLNGKFGEGRCAECYRMRFEETAKAAIKFNYRAFTTTLLVSPYQNHDLIKEVGNKVAKEFGTDFYYCDFRPGFKNTYKTAREHDLYMQKYCGCIFSEFSRYKNDKRFCLPTI